MDSTFQSDVLIRLRKDLSITMSSLSNTLSAGMSSDESESLSESVMSCSMSQNTSFIILKMLTAYFLFQIYT